MLDLGCMESQALARGLTHDVFLPFFLLFESFFML